ncbi:MAG: hypothetical protein STSR0001_09640 [Methanothrix sp.]
MMRTSIDSDLLTRQQLEALFILNDGEWYDRKDIHKKMGFKKFDYSIISERIIKPLEVKGIIEQEGREGTRRLFARIKKDIDLLLLMNLRDSYQILWTRAHERKDDKREKLYQKAYEMFDSLYQSHEVIIGTSVSLSPGQAELYKLACKIEKYCKSHEQAVVAACIARPDLYKEHQEWQIKYGPKGSRLMEELPKQ